MSDRTTGDFTEQPTLTNPGVQLSVLPDVHRERIPEHYRDEMGHMNVMWYSHLFAEAARATFLRIGLTPDFFAKQRSGAFVMESHLKFMAEVHIGETITVCVRMLGRSPKRFHLVYYMMNQSTQVLAATCESVFAYINMTNRRSAPIPPEIGASIDHLIARHAAVDWAPTLSGIMRP